jgi:signal transduction histidine kinase
MDLTIGLAAIVTTVSALSGVLGYFLMRAKFMRELALSKKKEEELARRAYETAILKEIGDRIGYSLDAVKIIEIISNSLGKLLPYSTVSHMIFDKLKDKINFTCVVNEPVSRNFINDVKNKMLLAASEMAQKPFLESEIDESIEGSILDDRSKETVQSYCNLPIIISGILAGIINVASTQKDLYKDENTEVLYRIAQQASEAVSKLQEVLENEKSRLSQAVESLSDGLLMADTSYHLVLVNKKLSQLLGILPNPSLFDIANALSGKFDLRSAVEEAYTTESNLPVSEITVKDKTLQVVALKVIDKKRRKPVGVVVLFRDITDAKSLEKLRQDFTSMIVHELRTPLTHIKSTTQLLREDYPKMQEDQLLSHLLTIDSSSQAMLELVGDLLDVAKIESGKFDVICESGDVGEAIVERIESFKSQAQAKNLNLSVQIEDNLPKVYFDKIRIKQVLNNLLSNAIKYTQIGEIKVRAASENINGRSKDIVVSIADTGIGIDPEEGQKLFSTFEQLERGRKISAVKGSGLGLYIVKGIVEASGGKVWFESPGAGMGSTFYFTLPLAEAVSEKGVEDGMPATSFSTQKIAHG